MNVVIDHALWCDHCGKYLGAANPSVRVFGKVLCLPVSRPCAWPCWRRLKRTRRRNGSD
jgi:hypothetical protein